jgi:hypothetical protein
MVLRMVRNNNYNLTLKIINNKRVYLRAHDGDRRDDRHGDHRDGHHDGHHDDL